VRSAIVNLSSIAGVIGSEHVHMAYNASKAAVQLMTKSVAVQHAKGLCHGNERGIERGQRLVRSHAAATASNQSGAITTADIQTASPGVFIPAASGFSPSQVRY
jgi:NAD(P)-dependent dehydrogenase (short-subunit alcohol dehydrogenase family)